MSGRGSLNAVYLIRKGQYYHKNKKLLGKLVCRSLKNKLIDRYGIFLHWDTKIDIGLHLPHPEGIIIGKACEIGKNCRILQQVTIGEARIDEYLLGKQPHIGDNCIIFSGAKIIGRIKLGNGTTVGANAVLNKDTEPDSVWAGIPAKRLK